MEAMSSHALDEASPSSQSFASLRQRPSQAKVRSTTQRLAMTTKALGLLRTPHDLKPWSLNGLQRRLQLVTGIAAIGKQHLQ